MARGIVLDMTAIAGENPVKEGTAFNKKEIDAALQRQNIELRKGDVVLFYTGWLSLVGKDNDRYNKAEPGLGKEGAEYLAGKEVLAVGADTWGLEVVPFEGVGVFEVHQILLAKNGMYILENMNTAALVADQAWEFMFIKVTAGSPAGCRPSSTPSRSAEQFAEPGRYFETATEPAAWRMAQAAIRPSSSRPRRAQPVT